MRFSILASALALVGLVAAAPTATEKRSCQIAPNAVARVEQAHPATSYLPGVVIAQDAGKTNKKDTFFEFYTPPGSYGCQLEAYFPAGNWVTASGNPKPARIDVYRVDAPLSRSPHGIDISWDYSPAPNALVGSVHFESKPDKPTKVVINSFQCDRAMAFRFRIASENNNAASVQFAQNLHGGGVRMVHNC